VWEIENYSRVYDTLDFKKTIQWFFLWITGFWEDDKGFYVNRALCNFIRVSRKTLIGIIYESIWAIQEKGFLGDSRGTWWKDFCDSRLWKGFLWISVFSKKKKKLTEIYRYIKKKILDLDKKIIIRQRFLLFYKCYLMLYLRHRFTFKCYLIWNYNLFGYLFIYLHHMKAFPLKTAVKSQYLRHRVSSQALSKGSVFTFNSAFIYNRCLRGAVNSSFWCSVSNRTYIQSFRVHVRGIHHPIIWTSKTSFKLNTFTI
jgi:hypothetical protein